MIVMYLMNALNNSTKLDDPTKCCQCHENHFEINNKPIMTKISFRRTTQNCCLSFAIFCVLSIIGHVGAAPSVCPQMLTNDRLPRFCAANEFGRQDVSRSEFEHWNCNNPLHSKTEKTRKQMSLLRHLTHPLFPLSQNTCKFRRHLVRQLYHCQHAYQPRAINPVRQFVLVCRDRRRHAIGWPLRWPFLGINVN